MRMDETRFGAMAKVDGYGPGFFRIGGQVHHGAVLVRASGASGWQGYGDTASLVGLSAEVDVVLVGTGTDIADVPPDFRAAIEAAGIGVEIMASATACRTYNVLLSEGRRVAAALLPV